MTKNEVKALIRQKIADTDKEISIASKRDNDEAVTYYEGYQIGLKKALQIIGMLDNEHNRLKSSL